jgi:uncharacterized protein YlxP (DUF503 family)
MTSKLTQTVRKARGILDDHRAGSRDGEAHVRTLAASGRRRRFNGMMATGFIGIYSFELHFPESHSLKEKRMHLRSVKAQLTNRIACSIAEVDHHDTWQRARLTLACVAREAGEADRLIDTAERWLAGQEFELLTRERDLVSLDD